VLAYQHHVPDALVLS
jgi:hypothetical protein